MSSSASQPASARQSTGPVRVQAIVALVSKGMTCATPALWRGEARAGVAQYVRVRLRSSRVSSSSWAVAVGEARLDFSSPSAWGHGPVRCWTGVARRAPNLERCRPCAELQCQPAQLAARVFFGV
jgi:hypothetical protein